MKDDRRIFAAGRWPTGFYIELVDEPSREGSHAYPDTSERIFVGEQEVGELLQEEGTPRLAYEHHGAIRCGWCDRPLEECRTDPCDHYAD